MFIKIYTIIRETIGVLKPVEIGIALNSSVDLIPLAAFKD